MNCVTFSTIPIAQVKRIKMKRPSLVSEQDSYMRLKDESYVGGKAEA